MPASDFPGNIIPVVERAPEYVIDILRQQKDEIDNLRQQVAVLQSIVQDQLQKSYDLEREVPKNSEEEIWEQESAEFQF